MQQCARDSWFYMVQYRWGLDSKLCLSVCVCVWTDSHFQQHSEDTEEDVSNIYLSSDLFTSKSKLTTN